MVEEQNLMEEMLKKGDLLRQTKYKDFDFSTLDAQQEAWIKRLSLYTRFRQFAINRWEIGRVSNDMKISFIHQHSMKLGNGVFYHLEGHRQKYMGSLESFPYLGGFLGCFYIIGFAYRTPLASKLYKEAVISLFLGCATASTMVLYYRRAYIAAANDVYLGLKMRLENFPQLLESDGDHIIKNFGNSNWSDPDVEGEEEHGLHDVGIFEGDEQDWREENEARFKELM